MFLIIFFKFPNTKLIGWIVYNMVKSNKSTLLAETIAREFITCNELLTLQYGTKLKIFWILQQYTLNLFLISSKIHDRSVAKILVGLH
jgi:hypothetical protein